MHAVNAKNFYHIFSKCYSIHGDILAKSRHLLHSSAEESVRRFLMSRARLTITRPRVNGDAHGPNYGDAALPLRRDVAMAAIPPYTRV